MTQSVMDNELLVELFAVKEKLATTYSTTGELFAAAQRFSEENPSPPRGPGRKLIDGFPVGQSVADEDEVMRELYEVKEQIAEEYGRSVKGISSADPTLTKQNSKVRKTKALKKAKTLSEFRRSLRTKK